MPLLSRSSKTCWAVNPIAMGEPLISSICAGGPGWYYDDPIDPKIINLCPASCTAVEADDKGKIEIILGCETKPA